MSNGDSVSQVNDLISSLDAQAAAWYRGITGAPVVVPATNPQIAAQQQIAIQQQQQALLATTNPTLAGILANPTAIIVILAVVVLLIVLAFRLG